MSDNKKIWDAIGQRIERLSVADPNSGCWLWGGSVAKNGYGTMTVSGKTQGAHRASYAFHHGPIPEGMAIDHKCKVRCCVNPEHLEAVTYAENNRRSPRRKPLDSSCRNGLPYSADNLYRSKWRRCAECSRVAALASYHKRKTLKRSASV